GRWSRSSCSIRCRSVRPTPHSHNPMSSSEPMRHFFGRVNKARHAISLFGLTYSCGERLRLRQRHLPPKLPCESGGSSRHGDVMSDEPKRSRAWVGRAAIAFLLAYPLSYGPALWLSNRTSKLTEGRSVDATFKLFQPVEWAAQKIGMREVLRVYLTPFI